jgi:hypothetical protein
MATTLKPAEPPPPTRTAPAGIDAAAHRHVLDGADHPLGCKIEDCCRSLGGRPAERRADRPVDHGFGSGKVELYAPAKEMMGIEVTQRQGRVGDRGESAAPSVEAGPGWAPALCGPTDNSPASSTLAMLPPPAPMQCTSTAGSPTM